MPQGNHSVTDVRQYSPAKGHQDLDGKLLLPEWQRIDSGRRCIWPHIRIPHRRCSLEENKTANGVSDGEKQKETTASPPVKLISRFWLLLGHDKKGTILQKEASKLESLFS
eukprot:m.90844 g.90844  ORF g.90844 m.90844 type:complete len:111 (+) comp14606_c0_seq2:368-700(+)